MLLTLAITAVCLAALPALLFVANLKLYLPAPLASQLPESLRQQGISVLIPARNEEASIRAAVEAVLANTHPLEVIVLDDHSTDGTAAIVRELANRDSRVRYESAQPLPSGWCGKQHACATLATLARYDYLLFVDADVRLSADALPRLLAFQAASQADLVSGFPQQVTGSFFEKLAIPLIHFLLLGFLPMSRMRQFPTEPPYAAGCGQLFFTTRASYQQMGGHATIKTTLHDGIKLPRAYRQAGLKTDLFDATEVAQCRMYQRGSDVWSGLAKNATEGLATPVMIVPATVLLLGGQVLPFVLLVWQLLMLPEYHGWSLGLTIAACLLAYTPRLVGVGRFRQSMLGAVLHPFGILYVVSIQWYAFVRKLLGRQSSWRGRAYPAGS
jgi:hypothetical protein